MSRSCTRPIDMSYSMTLEDGLGTSPDATLQMRQRNVDSWIPDDAVSQCYACGKAFGWFVRKHHCRACGRIFCYQCSDNHDQLPRDLERFPMGSGTSEWLASLAHRRCKAERTCDKCHRRLQKTRYVWDDIRAFDLLGWDVAQLHQASLVNKRWCRAALVSLSALREIQYRLPVQQLSVRERQQLWLNREWLRGHSVWCWQLLRAFPSEALLYLMEEPRRATCHQLMCTGRCAPQFSPSDALYFLLVPSECAALRSLAVESLDAESLDLLLPHLVHALRYELPVQRTSLLEFLLSAATSPTVLRRLYWLLRVEQAPSYSAALQRLLGEHNCDLLQRGLAALREMPTETDCLLPVFDEVVLGILVDEVKTKSSASRPKVWPCRTELGVRQMLYKTQEVRSDLVVMTVIRYMDALLKAEEQLDLGIVTYEVMPTGPSSGVIAMVKAETLEEIQRRGSLLNTMLQHNQHCVVHELRQRFIRSTAAYCVVTYLLGIGDRHLENIMMTREGRLFHVDFGFMLGADPKPYAAPAMRLSESMVEAIGGVDSPEYRQFQQLCTQIYNCLRRHVIPITTLLLLVPYPEDQLKAQVLARFVPGETRIEAQLQLTTRIEDSRSSLSATATDFLHQQAARFSLKRLLTFLYEDSD